MKAKESILSVITLFIMYWGINWVSQNTMAEGDTLRVVKLWWNGLFFMPLYFVAWKLLVKKKGINWYKAFVILYHFSTAATWWFYLHPSEYAQPGNIIIVLMVTAGAILVAHLPPTKNFFPKPKNIFCL